MFMVSIYFQGDYIIWVIDLIVYSRICALIWFLFISRVITLFELLIYIILKNRYFNPPQLY